MRKESEQGGSLEGEAEELVFILTLQPVSGSEPGLPISSHMLTGQLTVPHNAHGCHWHCGLEQVMSLLYPSLTTWKNPIPPILGKGEPLAVGKDQWVE